jgi:hypothetical protein
MNKFKIPQFWESVVHDVSRFRVDGERIKITVGCYVFGIKHGNKIKPYYVGSTCADTGFKGEIFQPHKRDHYYDSINSRNGAPQMFLFPMVTPERRAFVTSNGYPNQTILWLERLLITLALRKNSELRNLRDTKNLREAWVEGVLGAQAPGRPHTGASAAKRMLF